MPIAVFDRFSDDLSLTFDDVMLEPAMSYTAAKDVSLMTHFSSNIPMVLPFVLENATVESAIHAAQLGGIGILPNGMAASKQSDMVRQVKRFQSRIVRNIVAVTPETSILDALEYWQRYDISVMPVEEAGTHVFAGFLIFSDIDYDPEKTVSHYMSAEPALTIPDNTELNDIYAAMDASGYVALLDVNGRCVGLVTRQDQENFAKFPHATIDKNGALRVAAIVGIGNKEMDRVNALIDAGVDAIIVQSEHGHSKEVLDMVSYIRRQRTAQVDVIAGNICTGAAAIGLMDAGANGLMAGMCCDYAGLGVGVPQFSAILHVADASLVQNIPVIAAPVSSASNTNKSFAAGARTMLVSTMDGHEKLLEHLRTAISYTGCASLKEFNTQTRFVRIRN